MRLLFARAPEGALRPLLQYGVALLVATMSVLVPSSAFASGQELCEVVEDGCCVICRLSECDTGEDHPERRCTTGSMLHSLQVDQAKCDAAGISNGAAYCAALDPRTVGECNPPDFSDNEELPNGIDDDCDGAYLDDETCDGKDDDRDGRVDEGAGSCLERHLFVPVCWTGNSQDDFDGVVDRWERFFQERTVLQYCGINVGSFGVRKIWYESAKMGTVACPAGAVASTDLDAMSLLDELKKKVDLRDWDFVTFATRLPLGADCIVGHTQIGATGVIFVRSDGVGGDGGAEPKLGENMTWAHEWGHNIANAAGDVLGEEYKEGSPPNRVRASLGCDPSTCCKGAHCNPTVNGKLCKGNLAKDLTDWTWGDADPPDYGDDSRCIMSHIDAPGSEDVDPITGFGSHRSWCQACLNHLEKNANHCTDTYPGGKRRLEMVGKVDAMGNLTLAHLLISDGRMGGGLQQGGEIEIELFDSAGAPLGSFAPEVHSVGPEIEYDGVAFLARMPVASTVDGPITLRAVKAGVQVSQVTGNGQPAVAVASNVVVECTSAAGTPAVLDGSASYDPDGDTLSFAWTSSLPLVGPDGAVTSGSFPLGTTAATLSVKDGTGVVDTASIGVVVQDTTGPVLQVTNVAAQTCVPAPTQVTLARPNVMAECSGVGSVSLTAKLTAVNGKTLPNPVDIDPAQPALKLPVGTSTVRWTGRDPSGNATSVSQTVTVSLNETSSACCGTKTLVEGTDWPDLMLRPLSGQFCLVGRAGIDTMAGGPGADFLFGGTGNDSMTGGSDNDLMSGGAGGDTITFPLGQGMGYGGEGNDILKMTGPGTLYGNAGDDTLTGILGDHVMVPGPGLDRVLAGPGNDVVYVHDVCELTALEVLDGSLGSDTLYLPEPLQNVLARGVVVLGFEQIIVTTQNRHLSECF